MYVLDNAVGGKRAPSASARTTPVFNPATGEEIGKVPLSSLAEIDAAVQNAKEAQPAWGNLTPAKRAAVFFKFAELLHKHADEIAREISREHGKTHADALGELARGIEIVEFACGIPHLLKGEYSRNVGPSIDSYSDRQPLGVVAGITPFNFPAMVPMWMYPLAIASGNAFILKPSERDPSAPLAMAWDLFMEAGLPPGILNIVQGDKTAVDAHSRSPRHQGGQLSSARPRSPIMSTNAERGPASAYRRSAAPRTTWSSCPTPISTWRRTP